MINILFIAFEFAPLNRGGVFRPLAFVEHLPKFGIQPIVITLSTQSYANIFDSFTTDNSLGQKEINADFIFPVISNQASLNKSKLRKFLSIYFSIHGNETQYWKRNFYDCVDEIIKTHAPRAIFATVPPFSVLPLASNVSQKYGLPLIFDFRDAWSQWRTIPYGSIFHYWLTLFFEKKYLLAGDLIIATSEQTITDFKALHPEVPQQKYCYLPNGYNGGIEMWQSNNRTDNQFIIGYVGSFYYNPMARDQMLMPWWKKRFHRKLQFTPSKQDWLYRSPYFFFRALQKINELSPEIGQRIKVKFIGKKPDWLVSMINEFHLSHQIELLGEFSHREALLFQKECDALLITSAKQINGKDYSIAGKTFEYIQMQKPILAFVSDGAQKDLLEKTGIATIFDPDNSIQCAHLLEEIIMKRVAYTPNIEFIRTLSRANLSEQLAIKIKSTIKDYEENSSDSRHKA